MKAMHESDCDECGNPIYPGDAIERQDDIWVHIECSWVTTLF